MIETKVQVMEENWDLLIILDACRYDFFKGVIGDYMTGSLEKRISIGSCTPEWLNKSFKENYPHVIYVSGNPHINSKREVKGFNANKHFNKIIDVWSFDWNKELGTVPPENINKATIEELKKSPEKKFIVHYVQPHAPYISEKYFVGGFLEPFTEGPLQGFQGGKWWGFLEKFINLATNPLIKAELLKNRYGIREKLRLPPESPIDAVRRRYGVDGLRKAYVENLRIVSSSVCDLIQEISKIHRGKKIIITSDHGELLGEKNVYSHPCGNPNPIVREIPWFTLYKVKEEESITPRVYESEKQRVRKKIEKLRAFDKI